MLINPAHRLQHQGFIFDPDDRKIQEHGSAHTIVSRTFRAQLLLREEN